ncbi:hypothetical protein B1M_43490, partial [Burkholderia sp. TJI49]
ISNAPSTPAAHRPIFRFTRSVIIQCQFLLAASRFRPTQAFQQ